MHKAYDYIKANGGIDDDRSYPYEGVQKICRYKSANSAAKVSGYVHVRRSEEELKKAVATVGPIAVAIDSTRRGFHEYRSGVYHDPRCSNRHLTHAVLIVGYGTENGQDYWHVKNSWGTSWGASGYIKMARNKDNHCGIANYAIYPTV